MKREDLEGLGLEKSVIDKIMGFHGATVNEIKNQLATTETERDSAKKQLDEANAKLEGYDPEWKTKAEQMKAEAEQELNAKMVELASERAVQGLQFSSLSAKKAFINDLTKKNLQLEDGKFLGFDDFVKSYQTTDPDAFKTEQVEDTSGSSADIKLPRFSDSVKPDGLGNAETNSAKANNALRELFKRD